MAICLLRSSWVAVCLHHMSLIYHVAWRISLKIHTGLFHVWMKSRACGTKSWQRLLPYVTKFHGSCHAKNNAMIEPQFLMCHENRNVGTCEKASPNWIVCVWMGARYDFARLCLWIWEELVEWFIWCQMIAGLVEEILNGSSERNTTFWSLLWFV